MPTGLPTNGSLDQFLKDNEAKGRWLLNGIDRLDRAIESGSGWADPLRKSLRKRLELVLRNTRAEPISEEIQDHFVPLEGEFQSFSVHAIATVIRDSNDQTLLEVFSVRILEHELGV
jgi:hypothetical protein